MTSALASYCAASGADGLSRLLESLLAAAEAIDQGEARTFILVFLLVIFMLPLFNELKQLFGGVLAVAEGTPWVG